MVDQENLFQLRFDLLGGIIRHVENLIIVGWNIGVQLNCWTVHQTWRCAYVGIKKANNKWTYNLTNYLMKNFLWSYWYFETIIILASMTYIVDLDAYKLHPRDEKVFNHFMLNARICILHMIEVDCYSKVYLYIYVNDYIWM